MMLGGAFARLLGYHDAASFDALTPALAAQLLASVDAANHLGSRVIGPREQPGDASQSGRSRHHA
mgnify:CR=1 FL=1